MVVDTKQTPIANATVRFGRSAQDTSPTATTDESGQFELNRLRAGPSEIVVSAAGFAPKSVDVSVESQTQPLRIQLDPGGLLKVRVIDENQRGVAGVRIQLESAGGQRAIDWGGFTDENGQIEWDAAPTGLRGDALEFWKVDFYQSEQGRAHVRVTQSFPITVSVDGTFVAEDVPAGSYALNVRVFDIPARLDLPSSIPSRKTIASLNTEITVPDQPANSIYDVGTLTLQ